MGKAVDCKGLKVAIDFDNTIIKGGHPFGWDSHYEFLEGALWGIYALKGMNCELMLNSARYGWYRIPMIQFIRRHRLPISYRFRGQKPQADIYIDDSNLHSEGKVNWQEIVRYIGEKNTSLKRL